MLTAINDISKYVSKKVYQYEVQTSLYMMEPWEKFLFNTLALCILGLSIAATYHFTFAVLFSSIES